MCGAVRWVVSCDETSFLYCMVAHVCGEWNAHTAVACSFIVATVLTALLRQP